MAVKVNPSSVLFGVATLVLTTLANTAAGEGLPRDCMLNQVKANSKNPHTFYWCLPDGPVLFHCVDDLVFDTHAKKCITAKQKQKQQKSRDKRGSKVTVTPSSAAQAQQSQKDKKPQAQPDKKPTPQTKPEKNPAAQAQPDKKPTPQTKPEKNPAAQAQPEKNPSAQAQPEKNPATQAQPEKKPTAPESQDKKSTSPYYYSTLYPFPSRYIPSQPSVPVTAVASQAAYPVDSQAAYPVISQAASPVISQAASPVDSQATSPVFLQASSPVASQAASPEITEFLPDCPVPQYGRDAPLILIPSQDYCDEFFFCSNGESFRFTCPKDTDFNSQLRVCDHVRNIKCPSGKRRRDLVKQDESAVPRDAPSSPISSSS